MSPTQKGDTRGTQPGRGASGRGHSKKIDAIDTQIHGGPGHSIKIDTIGKQTHRGPGRGQRKRAPKKGEEHLPLGVILIFAQIGVRVV